MVSRIYYGVHVPSLDLAHVAAFEADAQKAVAIVMWYQQWGMTDGSQYLQSDWMNEVRAHGSIPLVTWEPWDPFQGVNCHSAPAALSEHSCRHLVQRKQRDRLAH